jgi:raffinose/stachyose/melibiose transport system substrate-binding protein
MDVKRRMFMLISVVMVIALLAGCGGGSGGNAGEGNTADTGDGKGKTEKVTLKIFQFKVEIAEAMNKMAAEYEKETGVKLEIETVGGGADYGAALKAKLAAGEEPDIFNNSGFNLLDPYLDRATDLSDQAWVSRVSDLAKQPMERDGKMYGMPMTIEGHGLIYNKELFKKAGIEKPPVTLTEFKETFKKLKDAGIQPISNGFGEWWVLMQYLQNATALHPDPIQFSKDVADGKLKVADDPFFQKWIDFFNLVLEYSNPNPLTTDYNTQVTLFAAGETAMLGQGNWTQVQIDGINPDLDLGMLPIPVGDAPTESGFISAGVPNNWVVNTKGAHPEEAKAFLDWLVSSDTGKKYLVKDFKFIPALTGIDYAEGDLGDIAEAILEYVNGGKAHTWSTMYPETYDKEWSSSMQAYVAKKIDAPEMLKQFDEAIAKLSKK